MIEHLKDLVFLTLEAGIFWYVKKEYDESSASNKLLKTLIGLLKVKRPNKNMKNLIREVVNVGIKGS